MKKTHRFSLRLKLVLLTTVLAIITYSFSGIFIYVVHDWVKPYWDVSKEWFTVLTLIKGIIWSGILAYFAGFILTRPLERLERTVSHAKEGHLNEEVTIPQSDDEIRSLSIAFQAMLDNLQDMVHRIEQNFQMTNTTVGEVRQVADDALSHANHIKESIAAISEGAVSSSSAIHETSLAIEEATALAESVGEKANESKEKSETMLKTLTESTAVVSQLIEGIQTVATDQERSLKDVMRLKENATEVESIITMVAGLAEQTNLLALNASIEASRAGEHGQGFAVVAEEVRKLADESTAQVTQIANLITAIQEDVGQVVEQITKNVEYTNEEAKIGEDTNNSMSAMSSSIVDVAGEIDEISSLVTEQLQRIRHTMAQSQEVAQIAENTSAGAQEMHAAIEEQTSTIALIDDLAQHLDEQAQELNKDIDRFHIS